MAPLKKVQLQHRQQQWWWALPAEKYDDKKSWVTMTTAIHAKWVQREVEYLFSTEDAEACPHLGRLLQQGYSFVILQCGIDAHRPHKRSYILACETICSNGTELLQRRAPLTPGFGELQALEHFTQHNMLSIMQKHFLGGELVEVG